MYKAFPAPGTSPVVPWAMASPPSDQNMRYHERFYFSDGSLHLLVEKSLYRVHRSLFEMHASHFPACNLDTCDDETYVLEDVKQIDFDRLLACLYPRNLLVEEAETTEEWVSILKLASKWGFEILCSRAISKIEQNLASPVDLVVLGRQYNIPDIILSGYATLCQDTTPLSSEEGRRLGVEDVVNIYQIRHELHGSTITSVSFESALEKVRIFLSNEEQEDSLDLETERPDSDPDDEQTSEQTDAGSVVTSSTSLAEEVASLTADTYTDTGSSDGHVVGSLYEQQWADANLDHQQTIFDIFFAGPERLDAQAADPVFEQRYTDVSLSDDECCESFDKLTQKNFGPVSDDILQWIQAKPHAQRLYNTTRMTVKKAMEEPRRTDTCVLLCKKMSSNLKGKFQQITGAGKFAKGTTLFRRYLGEICREILVAAVASVAAANKRSNGTPESKIICPAKDQRLRLIEFMARLSGPTPKVIKSRVIVNKWITSLLDPHDEEKSVTLCLLLTKAGPSWDTSNRKLRACMDSCFQTMTELAQKTNSSRIRTLLQDMIKYRQRGWIAA